MRQAAILDGKPAEKGLCCPRKGPGLADAEQEPKHKHLQASSRCTGQSGEHTPDRNHNRQRLAWSEFVGDPPGGHLKQCISNGENAENQPHPLGGYRKILLDIVHGRGYARTIHVRVDTVEKEDGNQYKTLTTHPTVRLFHIVTLS